MRENVKGENEKCCDDGKTTEFALLILFSPREPLFRRRCAPLKVSLWRRMSADATGIFILTGRQRVIASLNPFSPPLTPSFVAAFAALRVSFPGACPGKDESLFGRRDNILAAQKLARMFSPRAPLSFSRYVSALRKRIISIHFYL